MTTEHHPSYPDHAFDAIRENLADKSGPDYWRSLEELSQTEAFKSYIHNEFPLYAPAEIDGVTRRNFLQVMGATLALAGVTAGCARQPDESIFPYVQPPEEVIPGKPLFFASAALQNGYAKPVLVESHTGRPTKIEGLPKHSASLGRTDAQTQASILDLYDPDRAKVVTQAGIVDSWDNFIAAAKPILDDLSIRGGEGVRILTGTVTSPTLAGMIRSFLRTYPNAKWHQYEPAGRQNTREGARTAFGEYADTVYHFDRADVIVSLDGDFLDRGPGNVRYTADYAHRRDVVDPENGHDETDGSAHAETNPGEHAAGDSGAHGHAPDVPENLQTKLNRLYAFESSPNNVGANADHRFPLRPSQIEAAARRIADGLGIGVAISDQDELAEDVLAAIEAVIDDLRAHRGASAVVVGEHQPPVVHAIAHAINDALGNVGKTITYIDPVEAEPVNQLESLGELADDMAAGKVQMFLNFGTNPVYTSPADIDFVAALQKVPFRAQVSPYLDETGQYCHWHIPENHYLETWGDARAFDGTVSLIQPLIAPLYEGQAPAEVLSALFEEEPRTAHDIVQDYWKQQRGEDGFDRFWRQALSQGYIDNTAFRPKRVRVRNGFASSYTYESLAEGEFEVAILPDPSIGDGAWTNNAWLMELPRPLTKLTWDNAVLVGYSTAQNLGLKNEDVVEVSYNGATVRGPVWVQPGHCSRTVTLSLGFGRTRAGKVGNGMGFDVYPVMTSDAPTIGRGAKLDKKPAKYALARTEEHYNMEGRWLARHVTPAELEAKPDIVKHGPEDTLHTPAKDETLYNPEITEWHGYQWGMTIDLNKCTGCNACIIACQSENVIPTVGKTEVRNGREMHWIRVDRYYYAGDAIKLNAMPDEQRQKILDNPQVYYQPVPCMQCENAPCEVVCPVGATQHSQEGLNDMVYNRCIGTRYCSNNCPYKVRRFNFYHFSRTPLGSRGDRVNPAAFEPTHVHPETLRPMRNPDVTVRGRGVMEKCTYCVQRINHARIEAKKSGEPIRDADCVTACQQACPANAITFGDINNADSAVSHRKKSYRNYGILAETNTKPRTTYLARVTNPNPSLSEQDHTEMEA